MPKYIVTNGIIISADGKSASRQGEEITLTAEAAESLSSYVVLAEIANPDQPLVEKTVKDLKELAKAAKIQGYSTMDHAALVVALEAEL